MERMHKQIIKL